MPTANVAECTNAERKRWMGILARADINALEGAYDALPTAPQYTTLRKPETGLVMVEARANGTGRRFNAGEMTVTRCSVRLPDGIVGHAYIAGRSRREIRPASTRLLCLMIHPLLMLLRFRSTRTRRGRSTSSPKARRTSIPTFLPVLPVEANAPVGRSRSVPRPRSTLTFMGIRSTD